MQSALHGGLAPAIAGFLWPSEVQVLQAAAQRFTELRAAALRFLTSPEARRSLLQMIAAAAGSATAEAVLSFDSSPAKPWPSFEDGLLVLWCCDQPIHRERKAMQVALRSGPVMAVRWLLAARADVEQPVEGDLTPLRLAARFGSEELIEMLLEGSANPNSRGRFGNTALMVAAMHGHHHIVELLLSNGSQVNTNGDGETAIDLACRYPDVADLLTRHVSQYGWTGARPLKRVWSQEFQARLPGFVAVLEAGRFAFQAVCMVAIIANTMYLGVNADWKIRNAFGPIDGRQREVEDTAWDITFAVWFSIEILLRLLAEKISFFTGEEQAWNLFDSFLVVESIVGLLFPVGAKLS
ncbi:ANK3, partial [Symbiodinium sp. CCMP2456]